MRDARGDRRTRRGQWGREHAAATVNVTRTSEIENATTASARLATRLAHRAVRRIPKLGHRSPGMAANFFQLKPSNKKVGKDQVAVDPNLQPWVEKYRPKTIDDVSAQEHIVAVLEKTLSSTNLPHMLFYGPPGTGKTSTILALARQLYGPDNFRTRVLELNASDERGISIVRDKVKNFARQTPRAQTVASDGKVYPCPPYKIIILDEADSMTQDAQAALRRIMENYARITRFCLV
ncbi:P-loop containing nucleoside triphosphate hydrolase protein, partial [Amylostereum chailletii]